MATLGTDRVALITGGSAGVGAATAKALAALGFRVVINYSNDSSRAEATIKDLQRVAADAHLSHQTQSPRFVAIKADVSTPDGITTLVERTISAMGRLDALISNHGWTRMTNLRNLDENINMSDWEKCLNMNVTSHLRLAHAARKYLEQSEGVVVVTSSTAGIRVSGSSLVRAPGSLCKATGMRLTGPLGLCSDKSCADPPGQMPCGYHGPKDPCQLCHTRNDDDRTSREWTGW